MTQVSKDKEEKMFEENVNLVRLIISRYFKPTPQTYDDIFQEGCCGLISAIRRYNPDLGYKFSTFACSYIVGTINHYLREHKNDIIKISRNKKALYYKLIKVTPDVDDKTELIRAAKILGVTCAELEEVALLKYALEPKSINTIILDDNDKGTALCDLIGDTDDPYGDVDNNDLLAECMRYLTDREKTSIEMYVYGYGQGEIAEHMGVTQPQVSKHIRSAKKKMRETYEGKLHKKETREKNLITYKGQTHNLNAWAKTLGIPYSTLKRRLDKGWELDKVFSKK